MSNQLPNTDGLLRIVTAPLALPTGLRDLLPSEARRRNKSHRALAETFERYGYERVVTPPFEREEAIIPGLDERARRELVRFVDPENGSVVVLRPDMTPQIARIAATRYRGIPGPLRFYYEGSVLRRTRGRSARFKQIAQVGIECVGWPFPMGDLEVISATLEALANSGLRDTRVELGHAAFASALLEEVAEPLRPAVTDALSARDTATLERLLGSSFRASSSIARALELFGDSSVLSRAEQQLTEARFREPLRALQTLVAALENAGHGSRVLIDLAEARGLGYYTGVSFRLLAEKAGLFLGGGGRYDTLLERYGDARPATGCAIELDVLEQALEQQPSNETRRRAVVGGTNAEREKTARKLRNSFGISTAESSAETVDELLGFARAHSYDLVLLCRPEAVVQIDPSDGSVSKWTHEQEGSAKSEE